MSQGPTEPEMGVLLDLEHDKFGLIYAQLLNVITDLSFPQHIRSVTLFLKTWSLSHPCFLTHLRDQCFSPPHRWFFFSS